MTKELFVSIMEKHLKELKTMVRKNFELIWDNAPKHISNLAKEFYQKNYYKRIDWPAYIHDLNSIENIWSIMKSRLNQISTSKISEVISKIKEIWEELNLEYIDNCIESTPSRLQECINNEGD